MSLYLLAILLTTLSQGVVLRPSNPLLFAFDSAPDELRLEVGFDTETQDIDVTDVMLGGQPASFLLRLSTTPHITFELEDEADFTPLRTEKVVDRLCGTTSLDHPCVGMPLLCCFAHFRRETFGLCAFPDRSYPDMRQYKIVDVKYVHDIVVELQAPGETPQQSVLSESQTWALFQIADLLIRVTLLSKGDDLPDLMGHYLLHDLSLTGIDSLKLLLYPDIYLQSPELWVDEATCTAYNSIEFDTSVDTIPFQVYVPQISDFHLTDGLLSIKIPKESVLSISVTRR